MRHLLEYAAVMVVWGLVRVLPRRASLGFGAALGMLFYHVYGSRRLISPSSMKTIVPSVKMWMT